MEDILAIHSGALGDVILFGHLLKALGGRVTLVAGGEKGRLLAGMNVVAAAADFDALPMHEVFSDAPPEACRLTALLGAGPRRLISCFAAGNAEAQGRLAALCGARSSVFLPVRPPKGCSKHLVTLWSDILGAAISLDDCRRRVWAPPPPALKAAGDLLGTIGVDPLRPYVCLHPGSGAAAKCWPLERFLELAEKLRQCRRRPVLLLGPAECERWDSARLQAIARFEHLQCPPLDVLAGVLAGACAYVGNDSGVTHLAAAVGTATIALFGPSGGNHFSPLGRAVTVIAMPALTDIAVDELVSRLTV